MLDAAFRRSGVLRVTDIGDVFRLADVLGRQPRPRGPRLTIVTNAGGPGVLATDALMAAGGELATLSDETLGRLDAVLPAAWSHANPLDILGDADPARYANALEIAADDSASDGLLAILTPQDMTDPTLTAEALAKHAHIDGQAGAGELDGGRRRGCRRRHPQSRRNPELRVPRRRRADLLSDVALRLQSARPLRDARATAGRRARIRRSRRRSSRPRAPQRRTLLDEHESKALLGSYGIPVTPTRVARDEAEAVAAAEALGFPVAVKLWSRTITHKTDVGGVKLGLRDAGAVAARVSRDQGERDGEGRRRKLPRRDGAALGRAAWRLRADSREQHRSTVRSGDALRDRRRAGRGVPRPGAWPCPRSTPRSPAG